MIEIFFFTVLHASEHGGIADTGCDCGGGGGKGSLTNGVELKLIAVSCVIYYIVIIFVRIFFFFSKLAHKIFF